MENSPLEFPGDHPIKVMGHDKPEFRATILKTIEERGAPVVADSIRERPSRDGTYLSFTVAVTVSSREELAGIYQALHATGLVLFAL